MLRRRNTKEEREREENTVSNSYRMIEKCHPIKHTWNEIKYSLVLCTYECCFFSLRRSSFKCIYCWASQVGHTRSRYKFQEAYLLFVIPFETKKIIKMWWWASSFDIDYLLTKPMHFFLSRQTHTTILEERRVTC